MALNKARRGNIVSRAAYTMQNVGEYGQSFMGGASRDVRIEPGGRKVANAELPDETLPVNRPASILPLLLIVALVLAVAS